MTNDQAHEQVKTIIENTIKNCNGVPTDMEIELASTMIEEALSLEVK